MIVTQRPGAIEFASNMPDYIIDSESTITFEVKLNSRTILSEEYSPDVGFKIRIRRLGQFCRKALYGSWPGNGSATAMSYIAGTFSFYINGTKDTDTFVLFSRCTSKRTIGSRVLLSSINEKVVRRSVPDYTSFFLRQGESVTVQVNAPERVQSKTLYTQNGSDMVTTLDTGVDTIQRLFPDVSFSSYSVGGMKFLIDYTSYAEKYVFRFKNMYDCTEIICATGFMNLKGEDKSETAYMYGIERKFVINRNDVYTVNSGVVFLQSDYRLWHDFLNCQEASILVDGTWYDIVITQQNYERDYRKSILKAVEFSFRLADPENSGVI